jgi:Raf kinase inhibitor-like YbhB/YbcL family protein
MKKALLIIGIIGVLVLAAILIRFFNTDRFSMTENLKVESDAFENGGNIPVKHTGKGEDVSPSLMLDGICQDAVSMVVIMDDLDFPLGTYNHWVMWNIPASFSVIPEAVPKQTVVSSLGNAVQGKSNYGGKHYYRGPLPPFGSHTYVFKVFVLDTMLELDSEAGKSQVMKAMDGHILQYGTLTGQFEQVKE